MPDSPMRGPPVEDWRFCTSSSERTHQV